MLGIDSILTYGTERAGGSSPVTVFLGTDRLNVAERDWTCLVKREGKLNVAESDWTSLVKREGKLNVAERDWTYSSCEE